MARPDLYYLDENEGDQSHPMVPGRSRVRRLVVALLAIALGSTVVLSAASPSVAAPGTRVNVEPDVLAVQVGQPVTLTAVLRDANGDPAIGPGASTHVRWYFAPLSANDPNPGNSSPSFECWTGEAGTCSMTYTPSELGIDAICALVGGSPSACLELPGADEWEDNADVVLRIVVLDPAPSPTPTPTPTPTPARPQPRHRPQRQRRRRPPRQLQPRHRRQLQPRHRRRLPRQRPRQRQRRPDADADTDANANADADADSHANAHANANADPDADAHANADARRRHRRQPDADSHADAVPDSHPDPNSSSHADAVSNPEPDADGNSHSDADGSSDCHRPDADAGPESRTEREP